MEIKLCNETPPEQYKPPKIRGPITCDWAAAFGDMRNEITCKSGTDYWNESCDPTLVYSPDVGPHQLKVLDTLCKQPKGVPMIYLERQQ